MFVVFEGIDGGGKTTLSNLVAALLRERGLVVEHVREAGRFSSNVTQAMRELGRDARNLPMTPRAELMLYLTREVQLLEEATRPALKRADIVIADRYVYTAETLAVSGRGMSPHEVTPLVTAAANGLVPDLVILVDVDPHVARARRRVSKLVAPDDKAPSRKGLAGTALQHRLRTGYLAQAAREPERWIVVDNTEADLQAMALALADAVVDARRAGVPAARGRMTIPASPAVLVGGDRASARAALLAWIDRRAEREPGLAAYFLDRVVGAEFDERRRALAPRAPAVVATALRWLHDAAAWQLRRELAAVAPGAIALSLASPAGVHAEAPAMLRALVAAAPVEVATALRGRDDDVAWQLRDQMSNEHAIRSVALVSGPRAWAIRDQWIAGHGGLDQIDDVAIATVTCEAVEGVGGDRAWAVRKAMRELAPVAALESLLLIDDDRAWRWRERDLERAPKPVMRSIAQSSDPRAWRLRERVAAHCEEVLDSIIGLPADEAWQLRAATLAIWPWSVVKSLGPLATTERGRELVTTALARSPSDLAVWWQVMILGEATGGPPRW